ncbi:hypothetical protein PG988_006628 [Apiospora saccharicola]
MRPGQSGPVEAVFSVGAGVFADGSSGPGTTLFHYSDGPVKVPGPWKRGRPPGGARKAPRKPAKGFQFVNLTPGKSAAVVRKESHRPAPETITKIQNPSSSLEFQATKQGKPDFQQLVGRLNLHQIQGVDPFGQAPITMEPYMLDLLRYYVDTVWKNFYTLEDLAGSNPVSEFWIPRAFQDCALIHTFVGCSVAYAYGYHAIAFQNRGLRHLQDAISVVKSRLDIPEATLSSTTIAVIAGIAMLEKGAGNHENWAVHMQGLRDLVEHRGGRQALASEPLVLHKIYRADLFGSLDTGQRSWFNGPASLHFSVQPTAPVRSEGFRTLFQTIGMCPSLRNCVRQLEASVDFWSVPGSNPQGDDSLPGRRNAIFKPAVKPTPAQAKHVRDVLTAVQYALVSDEVFRHCNPDTYDGRINNLCRIVLIIYSLTILHEPTPSYTLGRQIGRVFSRAYNDVMNQSPDFNRLHPLGHQHISVNFRLWALFLASAAMEGTECGTSRQFQAIFTQLAMEEYGEGLLSGGSADLKARLGQYLWVPCIHNAGFERIWQELLRVTELESM